MSEEIKEMNLSEMLFNRDERLLNYITNLQKENEDYKQRNEKASAFLKHLKNTFDESDEMYDLLNNAINILQGGDE